MMTQQQQDEWCVTWGEYQQAQAELKRTADAHTNAKARYERACREFESCISCAKSFKAMSLEDILLEFSTVVHGEVLMAVPRKRYDALAAELADWKRMRNEAMAQATFNRNEIDALAASVDRLTSDKARLAAELAARLGPTHPYKDGCYCSPCMIERQQDRIFALEAENTRQNDRADKAESEMRALEAALRAVRDARLDWAMVCPCSCDACDRFYESVRVATSAETS